MNSQDRWRKSMLEGVIGMFAQRGNEGTPMKIEKS
jgi:hypothetical protein